MSQSENDYLALDAAMGQMKLDELEEYDFLAHYGIKGQKWGIRRYQNPDGTLTEEGKKRQRLNDTNSNKSEKAKRIAKTALIAAGAVTLAGAAAYVGYRTRNVRKESIQKLIQEYKVLSDDELKKKVARLQLEKQYRALNDEEIKNAVDRLQLEKKLRDLAYEETHPGAAHAKRILEAGGDKALNIALAGAGLYGLQAIVGGKFDREEFAKAIFNGGPKKK